MTRTSNIFQSLPFIRISLLFATGIFFYSYYPFVGYIYGITIILLLFVIIFLLGRTSFRSVRLQNILIAFTLLLSGAWHASENTKATFLSNECSYYSGLVMEKPIAKNRSFQTTMMVCNPKENRREKVLAYFEKDSCISKLIPGSRIIFKASLRTIKNRENPFEFDYTAYMKRKGIIRFVYLKENDYVFKDSKCFNIYIWAEKWRDKLLSILHEYNVSGEEYSIVSALTLGYKKELNPEIKDYFASSGAMHVLAVSGLHVGIVYFIFTFLFLPLKQKKFGRFIYTVLIALSIWIYALLTGLSPSVQRAAVMFSFILVGQNLNRPVNIFNSLAASAFLLMLFNSQIIFEPGFQLSYLAVCGIVLFQPLFYKLLEIKNRLLDKIWILFTVSLAAQLSTFPLGLFYFSQFPNYFWLSNFIVIPTATLILCATFLLFLLSPISLPANCVGLFIQKLTQLMLVSLKWINSLPFAVTENISISFFQAIILLILIAVLYWFVRTKSIRDLRLFIIFSGVYFLTSFFQNYQLFNQKKMIVYNFDFPVIQFVHGRYSYVIADSIQKIEQVEPLIENVGNRQKLNAPVYIFYGMNTNFMDDNLLVNSNIISFCGKKIQLLFWNNEIFPNVDYLIIPKNFSFIKFLPEKCIQLIVLDKINDPDNEKFNIYQTSTNGAFVADFKEN